MFVSLWCLEVMFSDSSNNSDCRFTRHSATPYKNMTDSIKHCFHRSHYTVKFSLKTLTVEHTWYGIQAHLIPCLLLWLCSVYIFCSQASNSNHTANVAFVSHVSSDTPLWAEHRSSMWIKLTLELWRCGRSVIVKWAVSHSWWFSVVLMALLLLQ